MPANLDGAFFFSTASQLLCVSGFQWRLLANCIVQHRVGLAKEAMVMEHGAWRTVKHRLGIVWCRDAQTTFKYRSQGYYTRKLSRTPYSPSTIRGIYWGLLSTRCQALLGTHPPEVTSLFFCLGPQVQSRNKAQRPPVRSCQCGLLFSSWLATSVCL